MDVAVVGGVARASRVVVTAAHVRHGYHSLSLIGICPDPWGVRRAIECRSCDGAWRGELREGRARDPEDHVLQRMSSGSWVPRDALAPPRTGGRRLAALQLGVRDRRSDCGQDDLLEAGHLRDGRARRRWHVCAGHRRCPENIAGACRRVRIEPEPLSEARSPRSKRGQTIRKAGSRCLRNRP